jgi:hypothetical protein
MSAMCGIISTLRFKIPIPLQCDLVDTLENGNGDRAVTNQDQKSQDAGVSRV